MQQLVPCVALFYMAIKELFFYSYQVAVFFFQWSDHMSSDNESSIKYKLVSGHSYKRDGPSDLSEKSQT